MSEWVMDQLLGNKMRRGGSPAYHVVKGDLDTLSRETNQNSKDQGIDPEKIKVQVKFTLLELDGDAKAKFLKAMDWDHLRMHLKAATGDPGEIASRLRAGIASVDGTAPLRCLRIEDFHTKGLVGGDFDDGTNFNLLCRAEFKTSDVAGRGGSYGLGKAVLWRFSGLSTVLLSSLVKGGEDKGIRLFGRSDVPGHKLADGDEYDSGGWFGKRVVDPVTGVFAESTYGDDKLASSLHLDRSGSTITGTSALIVGFEEPEEDEPRDLSEIAEEILSSAERWFWPSMTGSNPAMEVEVAVETGGKITFQKTANPLLKWEPFIRARDAVVKAKDGKAKDPGEVAEVPLEFIVPERTFPTSTVHNEFSLALMLRLTRDDSSWAEHEKANTVAVFRGGEMVVKYANIGYRPLDEVPFFGVLMAGAALGSSTDHQNMEEFFRASEPPLHDDWKYTDSVKGNYKRGAKSRLQALWGTLRDSVRSLIEENVTPKDVGPEILAKLFPLGGGGKKTPPKKKVHTRILNHSYSSGKWSVDGEVICSHYDGSPWNIRIGFIAETDSGKGENLKISGLKTSEKAASVQEMGPPAEVQVDGSVDRFNFNATVEISGSLEKKDLDLTAIRLSH